MTYLALLIVLANRCADLILGTDAYRGVLTSWRPLPRTSGVAGVAHITNATGDHPVRLRIRTHVRIHLDDGGVATGLLVMVAALSLLAAATFVGVALGRNSVEPELIGVPRDRIVVEERTQPPVTVPVTEWRTRYVERAARSTQRVDVPERVGGYTPPKVIGCPNPPFGGPRSKGYSCDALIYARSLLSSSQFGCLHKLWWRESGWDPTAHRAGSKYYGIPQLAYLPHGTPARKQVDRGLSYIDGRYGTPCKAWAAFGAKGWY
jgi:hypothetical protein